ncbi:hypothetical protein [Sphingobium tyrosinilyticum]|uniref:Uncharacterized protein n=1 Tax=Sphingobium tyrosinilyticum TaxID=2715436 RepID=A0ABV9EV39_9SPHN
MIIPTIRKKMAAKSRSENLASRAFNPWDATDKVLQAVSTIRLPEPKGTIFDTVDTCSPFFPCSAAGLSRADSIMAAVAMIGTLPLPHFATHFRLQADPAERNRPFESGMAIPFANANENSAPLLPHRMQIIALL